MDLKSAVSEANRACLVVGCWICTMSGNVLLLLVLLLLLAEDGMAGPICSTRHRGRNCSGWNSGRSM
jgi:hypothetical protein